MVNRLAAEAIGTFWIVFAGGGAGGRLPAARHRGVRGIEAFGLSVVTMLYAIGQVSGGHLNPAVSVASCSANGSRRTSSPATSRPK